MDTITDKAGRIACPASLAYADLTTNYELHFTTPAQLAKHGGVCRKCAAKFKKHNVGVMAGKVETPADWSMLHDLPIQPDDHIARDVGGEVVQTTAFDFKAICEPEDETDAALGIISKATPEARQQAAELFGHVARWCFNGHRGNLRVATAKFAVVIAGLHPEILDAETFEQIGQRLNLTKAAISKHAVKFQDAFNVQLSRCRQPAARAKMRARRLGGPDRHHHDAKATGQADTPRR